MSEWWRNAVIYQIYPRSFCDHNGDGIGDLPGITSKLDYIADLGVDGIWISPFFKSPMKDYGYDISDYRAVDPMFGTLDDFDALLDKAHSLNLKIIIDLVLSHTSDQHAWFGDENKKDWYVWADGKDGKPPNNWVSVFGGSAWEYDERYKQYYLHNFLKEQPDLNFHNPHVQDQMLDEVKFWLERGVDGLRLDVVNFYFHDQELRDNPPRDKSLSAATQFEGDDPYSDQAHIYDKSRPENLKFIERLRALIDQYPDRFTVGEIGDDQPFIRAAEYTSGDKRLHTSYNMAMMSGRHKDLTASLIRQPIETVSKLQNNYPDSHPSWAFSNHDVVRAASRWHPDQNGFGHDTRLTKMLNTLLCSLWGTVFLYQGEELGLPEAQLAYEDLQDPWGKHLWPEWQGRDGCRTPIPWYAEKPQKSWLPVPDTHIALNVRSQQDDPNSAYHATKAAIAQRKTLKAGGDITFIDTNDEKLLAFTRPVENGKALYIFNLEDKEKHFEKYDTQLEGYGFVIKAL